MNCRNLCKGRLAEIPEVENPPVPDGPAAPGQPDTHKEDTPDDPMCEMMIAFAGGQLKEHCLRNFCCFWFNSAKITALCLLSWAKMLLQNQQDEFQ